jgi:hypothetical protein
MIFGGAMLNAKRNILSLADTFLDLRRYSSLNPLAWNCNPNMNIRTMRAFSVSPHRAPVACLVDQGGVLISDGKLRGFVIKTWSGADRLDEESEGGRDNSGTIEVGCGEFHTDLRIPTRVIVCV